MMPGVGSLALPPTLLASSVPRRWRRQRIRSDSRSKVPNTARDARPVLVPGGKLEGLGERCAWLQSSACRTHVPSSAAVGTRILPHAALLTQRQA